MTITVPLSQPSVSQTVCRNYDIDVAWFSGILLLYYMLTLILLIGPIPSSV